MLQTALALALLAGPPESELKITIELPADALQVGETSFFSVRYSVDGDGSVSGEGVPQPILQIEPPACVELAGKAPGNAKELSRNGFLQAPFERLLPDPSTKVEFRLVRQPATGDRFIMNVLAYLDPQSPAKARFVRRRFELQVAANAKGKELPATASAWGQPTLQIGEKAEPFDLPRADGSRFALNDVLGKRNIVITTYRAFW